MASDIHDFQGKVALVTGAGHGIGRVIAEELARAGVSVVISDLNAGNGEKAACAIREQGRQAEFIQADLRAESEISDLFKAVGERFGRLDVLVNNARPKLRVGPWLETLDEWDLAMDVLLKAPVLSVKHALPWMRKSSGSSIVNIGSTNAFFVSHQPPAYHVAKAGLLHLTRFLAFELGSQGIRVNAVCPGLVDLFDENKPLTSNPMHKVVTKLVVPVQRAAVADEIAKTVLFLCSSAAGFINGQVLTLDGGGSLGDHFHIARKALLCGLDKSTF